MKINKSVKALLGLGLMSLSVFTCIGCYVADKAGTEFIIRGANHKDIIEYSQADVLDYVLENKNSTAWSAVEYKKKKVNISGVPDYSQSAMVNAYNASNEKTIDGQCGIVSCTEIVAYYKLQQDSTTTFDATYAFERIFNLCYAKGYTYLDGTQTAKVGNCLKTALKTYGFNKKIVTKKNDLVTSIKDQIDIGNPVILTLSDHGVVVTGYTRYSYIITDYTSSGDAEYVIRYADFLIVNEGWYPDINALLDCDLITNSNEGMYVFYAK